jgi:2-succinyl-6-hydroxy-2,4-cyclohexadiene-1-carboxylate synthase
VAQTTDDAVTGAATAVATREVDLGEVRLTIDEAGAGGRPLVLVHGFTGSRTDFDMALEPLAAAGWHVVAPELRGHGPSSQPDDESAYSFEIFAADVLALADALGFDRFTLLGHSMGGMAAQVLALRAQDRIDGLVLMDTAPGAVPGLDLELVGSVGQLALTEGMDAVADLMADAPLLDSEPYRRAVAADPSYAERGDRQRRAAAPAMFAAMGRSLATVADRTGQLASIRVPTLVLVGDADEPFLDGSRRMAEAIPGAQLAVLPEAGHSPQFEAHAAWWAALSGFLASLPAATPAP